MERLRVANFRWISFKNLLFLILLIYHFSTIKLKFSEEEIPSSTDIRLQSTFVRAQACILVKDPNYICVNVDGIYNFLPNLNGEQGNEFGFVVDYFSTIVSLNLGNWLITRVLVYLHRRTYIQEESNGWTSKLVWALYVVVTIISYSKMAFTAMVMTLLLEHTVKTGLTPGSAHYEFTLLAGVTAGYIVISSIWDYVIRRYVLVYVDRDF